MKPFSEIRLSYLDEMEEDFEKLPLVIVGPAHIRQDLVEIFTPLYGQEFVWDVDFHDPKIGTRNVLITGNIMTYPNVGLKGRNGKDYFFPQSIREGTKISIDFQKKTIKWDAENSDDFKETTKN